MWNGASLQIGKQIHVPWADRVALSGYEMHMGRTYHTTEARAVATITRRGGEQVHESDGSRSADGRIWGCYLHGIFVSAEFRRAWLHSLGWHHNSAMIAPDPYDRLADRVQGVLDQQHLDRLLSDR
jgi:adenosylcobyric acid synthase